MSDQHLEDIINEIAGPNWVCPKPPNWNEMYKMLPDIKRVGSGYEPPLPLILQAWGHTSDIEKKHRFLVHLEWAREKSVLDEIIQYLNTVEKSDWIRMGEELDAEGE